MERHSETKELDRQPRNVPLLNFRRTFGQRNNGTAAVCSRLVLAQMRSADRVRRCLLLGGFCCKTPIEAICEP